MAAPGSNRLDDTLPAEHHLVLTRVFDAPRTLVWEAWTNPEHLARWWGPHQFTAPRVELDLRRGGRLFIEMRGPDGARFPMEATFRDVVPPERLVFTSRLVDDRGELFLEVLHTVTLEEDRGRTSARVEAKVLRALPQAAGPLSGMEEGWSQSLDKLASDVATRASEREMLVTRVLDAPRELVWSAWTNPARISEWWGPEGFTTTTEVMDVRPGGRWVHVMHGPDGTDYPNLTIFHEVVEPERLVYTNSGGEEDGPEARFRATVTFDGMGARTRVTMRAVFDSRATRDFMVTQFGAYEGAHQTLNRLARVVASGKRQASER